MTEIPIMKGIAETAADFGISQHYARQLALSGTVAAVRVGRGKILVNQQSVADYFNSCSLKGESEPEQLCNGIKPISVKIGR